MYVSRSYILTVDQIRNNLNQIKFDLSVTPFSISKVYDIAEKKQTYGRTSILCASLAANLGSDGRFFGAKKTASGEFT